MNKRQLKKQAKKKLKQRELSVKLSFLMARESIKIRALDGINFSYKDFVACGKIGTGPVTHTQSFLDFSH